MAELVVPSKLLDKSYIQEKVRVVEKWVRGGKNIFLSANLNLRAKKILQKA